MAVRIRADKKTIVCAAKSEEEPGDTYIGDGLHYVLGVELCVLSVCGYDANGADLWEFHAPITLDEKIIKEEKVMCQTRDLPTERPKPCACRQTLISAVASV